MSTSAERLRDAVLARRQELRLTHDDVKAAGGPSDTTMTKIEAATAGSLASRTLLKLDRALRWVEGSAESVLAGGDPVREDEPPAGIESFTDLELAVELTRRLAGRHQESDGHGQQPASITELHPKPPTAEEFDEGQAAARPKPDGSVRGPI